MPWSVELHGAFEEEFDGLSEEVQDRILALAGLLKERGPALSRPHADTLNGSTHSNLKELRFTTSDGVWRVAFAFDPQRKAILLVASDKSGGSEKRFYRDLIVKADARLNEHLAQLRNSRRR